MEQLDFNKTKKLMDKYKLDYPSSGIAESREEAIKTAKRIGYPVVLKVIAKEIIHKSDVGGVIGDIKNEDEVSAAYEEILSSVKKKFRRVKIEGVLVQKMEQGVEVIIGMKRDPQFGAVVMFGLGGVFVEVMKDVSFRIAPIEKAEAEEMINEIKGVNILKGVRGRKKVNISALVDLLFKVSKISMAKKDILELDLNPVIVDEKKAKVVDARIIVE